MTDPTGSVDASALSPVVSRLGRALALLGALGALAEIGAGLLVRAGIAPIVLAVAASGLLLAVQWISLQRASRPGANGIAWIAGSYLGRIGVLALALYLPRALGVDVRLPALAVIGVLLAGSALEMLAVSRARIPSVDARPSTGE